MLHCAHSNQNNLFGVVDDTSQKLIIPFSYRRIVMQKYGIVAYDEKGYGCVHLFDGTPVVRAMKNVVLLDNHLLLTSTDTGNCYIVDYAKRSYVCQLNLQAIMFFWGSKNAPKKQASVYTANTDFSKIFTLPEYIEHGAYLESLVGVCSKTNHKWGVFNLNTFSLFSDFKYNIMVQMPNLKIGVINENGTYDML